MVYWSMLEGVWSLMGVWVVKARVCVYDGRGGLLLCVCCDAVAIALSWR